MKIKVKILDNSMNPLGWRVGDEIEVTPEQFEAWAGKVEKIQYADQVQRLSPAELEEFLTWKREREAPPEVVDLSSSLDSLPEKPYNEVKDDLDGLSMPALRKAAMREALPITWTMKKVELIKMIREKRSQNANQN